MAYRWHPKLAEVDPDNPSAWGTCDRCGFITNLNRMVWQWDYRGTPSPINTRILTCGRQTCLDVPNPQMAPMILPPDPLPVFNARPEPYTLDETSWLSTEDGDVISAEDGDDLATPIPNPDDDAAASILVCSIVESGGSVATAYLDLFNGDPSDGASSVLALITGSATRTNIAASLTTTAGIAQNTDTITIDAASSSTTNLSWVGIYDAATDGNLLMSGTVSASPTITEGNPVQFNPLGLSIDLN
mgnify:CR=1 FL=1